jgi:hypothetical protein
MGQTARALQLHRKGLEILEALAAADPSNVRKRIDLAYKHETMGAAYAAMASRHGRRELWQQARDSYARSFGMLREIARGGALTGEDAQSPARLEKQIARCDTALRTSVGRPPE